MGGKERAGKSLNKRSVFEEVPGMYDSAAQGGKILQ